MDKRIIDPEVKKKALNYFFKNNATYEGTVAKFGKQFSLQTLFRWTKADSRWVSRTANWSAYPPELKLKAVLMYNRGKKNAHQICKELEITSCSSLIYWVRQFREYGKEVFMKNLEILNTGSQQMTRTKKIRLFLHCSLKMIS